MKSTIETAPATREFLAKFGKSFREAGLTKDGRLVFTVSIEKVAFLRTREDVRTIKALEKKNYCYTTWILDSKETAVGWCKELPRTY